jgi:hypothetical protein
MTGPFDFAAESAPIVELLEREAREQGRIVAGVRDGAEDIARLKQVLDLLAAYYGELKIWPG